MEKREYKSTPFALFTKDKLGKRTRAGIFAVTGNRDSGGDRIQAGAFSKTFAEQKRHARHLWNHDFSGAPTAKVDDLYEISAADLPDKVKEYAPDATGGAVVVRTYLDTERGNEILAALDAEAINEMSFAYEALKREYVTEPRDDGTKQETRLIKELRHYESSDVLWGMNPATLATLSMPLASLTQAVKALTIEAKAGKLDQAELLALKAELDALLATFEQPKDNPPMIATPQPLGAQLAHAHAALRQLEFSSRAGQ